MIKNGVIFEHHSDSYNFQVFDFNFYDDNEPLALSFEVDTVDSLATLPLPQVHELYLVIGEWLRQNG